jgi:hypothetical protein
LARTVSQTHLNFTSAISSEAIAFLLVVVFGKRELPGENNFYCRRLAAETLVQCKEAGVAPVIDYMGQEGVLQQPAGLTEAGLCVLNSLPHPWLNNIAWEIMTERGGQSSWLEVRNAVWLGCNPKLLEAQRLKDNSPQRATLLLLEVLGDNAVTKIERQAAYRQLIEIGALGARGPPVVHYLPALDGTITKLTGRTGTRPVVVIVNMRIGDIGPALVCALATQRQGAEAEVINFGREDTTKNFAGIKVRNLSTDISTATPEVLACRIIDTAREDFPGQRTFFFNFVDAFGEVIAGQAEETGLFLTTAEVLSHSIQCVSDMEGYTAVTTLACDHLVETKGHKGAIAALNEFVKLGIIERLFVYYTGDLRYAITRAAHLKDYDAGEFRQILSRMKRSIVHPLFVWIVAHFRISRYLLLLIAVTVSSFLLWYSKGGVAIQQLPFGAMLFIVSLLLGIFTGYLLIRKIRPVLSLATLKNGVEPIPQWLERRRLQRLVNMSIYQVYCGGAKPNGFMFHNSIVEHYYPA